MSPLGLILVAAPGILYGLRAQRRAMAIAIGLMAACLFGTVVTPWALYLVLPVYIGSLIDAIRRYRRLRATVRRSWNDALIAVGAVLVMTVVLRILVVESFKIPSTGMAPTLVIGDYIFANKLVMRWRSPERGEVIVFQHPCHPDRDYVQRVVALENDRVEIRCSVVHVNGTRVPSTLVTAKDEYADRTENERDAYIAHASRYRETIGAHTFDVFHDRDRPERDEQRRTGSDVGVDRGDFPGTQPSYCGGVPGGGMGPPPTNERVGQIVETAPEPATPCTLHRSYVVPEGHVFVLGDNRDNSNDSRYWGAVPVENVKGALTSIWYPSGRIGRIE